MQSKKHKIKLGILGCGAIGAGVAKGVQKSISKLCTISGVYDIDSQKAATLSKKISPKRSLQKKSLESLIASSDIILEAIDAKNTKYILREILKAKKSVAVMSVGAILDAKALFTLANKNNCSLIVPSGAIAGVDAIKASSLIAFDKITITTRKPIKGLAGNPNLKKIGINLYTIKKEKVIFQGDVNKAIEIFPKNINVAATLALACGNKKKLSIKIITSPSFKRNSHTIEMTGKSGKIVTIVENVPCPDNPKTSYLAVLSGIQVIKDFCQR